MKVLIRKSIAGYEYWDTEAKKTLFVPVGEKPDFEVTKDPDSMLVEPKQTEEIVLDLNKLTLAELKQYATDFKVDIPSDIKKKDDIINYLSDHQ